MESPPANRPLVRGVALTLTADHVRLPLPAMRQRSATDSGALRVPRIGPPKVGDELELHPVREIALREILSHAAGGTARVILPLQATKIRKGPFSIEIPEDARAEIDFAVEGGRILRDRERTRGDIVPDIGLPLGIKMRGIFLDDDGSLVADIARFPNLNLSWLNVAKLKVPESLDDMLGMLFERPAPDAAAADEKPPGTLPVRLREIRVEARDVVPRDKPLSLGAAGELAFGPGTRLDVDYSSDGIEIGGHVEVPAATLSGAGFAVRGLRASADGSAVLQRVAGSRQLAMELRCDAASIEGGTIRLLDGSWLELGRAAAEGVRVVLTRGRGEAHFHVAAERVRGRIVGGVVMTLIGRRVHPVSIADMEVEGAVSISDRHAQVDVEIRGARLEARDFAVPLGVALAHVASLEASGSGRLVAGTDSGYAFTGSLAVNASLSGGRLRAGPATARVVAGTQATLSVSRLGGDERLRELEASGAIEVKLASGSLPIGKTSRLQFSRGAQGTLALHSIALAPGDDWPRIEAGATVTAAVDPIDLEGLVELPAGIATVEAPNIRLAAGGDLTFDDVTIKVTPGGGS